MRPVGPRGGSPAAFATMWVTGGAGVIWMDGPDGVVIVPAFLPGENAGRFEEEIRRMDRSRLAVTIVEHGDEYTVLFYEFPDEGVVPGVGFKIVKMNRHGHYARFRDRLVPPARVYFTYTVRGIPEGPADSVPVRPEIEPFELERFRMVDAADLGLGGFKKLAAGRSMPERTNRYFIEAMGIVTDPDYEEGAYG